MENQAVVFIDLRINARVVEQEIARDKLHIVGRVIDVLAYVLCNGDAVVDFECLGRVLAGLLDICVGRSLDVGELVGLLILPQGLLHGLKVLLDDDKALVYEFRRIDGSPVLIADPGLIVNIDKGIQNGVCPCRICILQGKGHN